MSGHSNYMQRETLADEGQINDERTDSSRKFHRLSCAVDSLDRTLANEEKKIQFRFAVWSRELAPRW